jgi:HD-like signal output (HDOD) protein
MSGAHDLERQVDELVAKDAVEVPPQPSVALRLQKLVSTGRYGVSELASVVGEDQALAATLLRYANSARYRGYEQITSLHDAITRMGAADVCRTALALGVGSTILAAGCLSELRRKWWTDAYLAALCAQHLGDKRGLRRDEAFVCGLLHDFGRVLAVTCLEKILKDTSDRRYLPLSVWETSVDRLHVELGNIVARRWNLSALLRGVIASHHHPDSAGRFRRMVDVVVAADGVVAASHLQPWVTSRELGPVPTLRPDEVNLLTGLVPQFATLAAALEDSSGFPGDGGAPSQIEKPPTALEGEPRRGTFAVQVRRGGVTRGFDGLYATPDGVAFRGPGGPRQFSVVPAGVTVDGRPTISFSGYVVLHTGDREGTRTELRLFGVDAHTLAEWNRFYASLT